MAESLKSRLRAAANGLLHPLGLHLQRADRAFEMDGLLARAAGRGLEIGTWIDVGASDGSWSLRARRHFPRAKFLLFEPLAERQAELAALRDRHGFVIVPAAAGPAAGAIPFAIDPQLDGSGVAAPGAAGARVVPQATIDGAVAEHGLPAPFGLKLDTHGYELPVLAGATQVLAQAAFVVVETYGFQLTPDSLRFPALCAWLEARGFRCCDLADPMRRPADGAFWQVDLAFARADSPWFRSNRYEAD